jgi:hypothetical protein
MFKLFRKLFWLLLAFALGCVSSWALTRRVRRVADRYVPTEIRDRFRGNMQAAVSEGRDAMREREAELKGTGARDGEK